MVVRGMYKLQAIKQGND